ncbi:MAG: septum formation initiator family protein [Pseudomonadota bacterium]
MFQFSKKITGLRCVMVLQLAVFGGLQHKLWMGESGFLAASDLEHKIAIQDIKNAELSQRNTLLQRRVDALAQGGPAVEERARLDLGMIRKGETFFVITDPK